MDRLAWQERAAAIGAWRELSGYDHPADPIGPEPAAAAPDVRAIWHQALAALGPADGPDVRGMPDGRLLHLRDTYPIETAWAPQYVGDELRQVRAAAWDARLSALRAAAKARAAAQRGDHSHAAAQHKLAAGYQALEQAYRERETVFAQTMADRADWDKATRAQRQLAVAGAPPNPNPSPPPAPSVRSSPSPRISHLARSASGSRTWPPGTGPSPASSPTGKARRSVRRPRLRRPRPGVPRLDQPAQGADLAAAQARDPALLADPRTRDRPRRRLGSRRLTAAGWYLRGARDRMRELDRAGSRNWRGIARGCALPEACRWPYASRIEIRALTSGAEVADCQDMQARAHSCKEGCHGTSVHRRRPGFPEQRVSHGLAERGRPEHRDPGLEGHR